MSQKEPKGNRRRPLTRHGVLWLRQLCAALALGVLLLHALLVKPLGLALLFGFLGVCSRCYALGGGLLNVVSRACGGGGLRLLSGRRNRDRHGDGCLGGR